MQIRRPATPRLKALIALTIALLFVLFNRYGNTEKRLNNSVTLHAPSFVSVANAATLGDENWTGAEIGSFLDEEAGISAYFQSTSPITLSSIRGLYRTIETETSDYILGSIPVQDYGDSDDVHAYIHKDGWVLVYYQNWDPVAKIFDWKHFNDSIPTKLETALSVIAGTAGVPYPGPTYYDFRYPNATHMMFITESGNDSFSVKIPDTFGVQERSWSFGTVDSNGGAFRLDGVEIRRHSGCGCWRISWGAFSAAQFLPGTYHNMELSHTYGEAYSGLILVYKEP